MNVHFDVDAITAKARADWTDHMDARVAARQVDPQSARLQVFFVELQFSLMGAIMRARNEGIDEADIAHAAGNALGGCHVSAMKNFGAVDGALLLARSMEVFHTGMSGADPATAYQSSYRGEAGGRA